MPQQHMLALAGLGSLCCELQLRMDACDADGRCAGCNAQRPSSLLPCSKLRASACFALPALAASQVSCSRAWNICDADAQCAGCNGSVHALCTLIQFTCCRGRACRARPPLAASASCSCTRTVAVLFDVALGAVAKAQVFCLLGDRGCCQCLLRFACFGSQSCCRAWLHATLMDGALALGALAKFMCTAWQMVCSSSACLAMLRHSQVFSGACALRLVAQRGGRLPAISRWPA